MSYVHRRILAFSTLSTSSTPESRPQHVWRNQPSYLWRHHRRALPTRQQSSFGAIAFFLPRLNHLTIYLFVNVFSILLFTLFPRYERPKNQGCLPNRRPRDLPNIKGSWKCGYAHRVSLQSFDSSVTVKTSSAGNMGISRLHFHPQPLSTSSD